MAVQDSAEVHPSCIPAEAILGLIKNLISLMENCPVENYRTLLWTQDENVPANLSELLLKCLLT